jgi:hypothetical protein
MWKAGGRSCTGLISGSVRGQSLEKVALQLLEALGAVCSAAQLTIDLNSLRLEQMFVMRNHSTGARVIPYDRTG